MTGFARLQRINQLFGCQLGGLIELGLNEISIRVQKLERRLGHDSWSLRKYVRIFRHGNGRGYSNYDVARFSPVVASVVLLVTSCLKYNRLSIFALQAPAL